MQKVRFFPQKHRSFLSIFAFPGSPPAKKVQKSGKNTIFDPFWTPFS
jgi:hypothetical protein